MRQAAGTTASRVTWRLPMAVAMSSVLAGAGLVAFTPQAEAALVTQCVGEGGDVTVPGDLVVPAGETCWLDGTTIEGDVKVRKNADMVASGGTVKGRVHAAKNGYIDTTDTDISGNVGSRNSYGTYLSKTQVHGAVNANNSGTDNGGFVYAVHSEVGKRLHAKVPGEVVVDGSQVRGPLTGNGTKYTDVNDSTLEGQLSVTNNAEGATFCDSEVYGSVSYADNDDILQIGADGPVTACAGVSFFGASLDISDNTGTIRVSDTIIAGNLAGAGNDSDPEGKNNRVRGEQSGQFSDMQKPSASKQQRSSRSATHPNRDTTAGNKTAKDRRAHAKAKAEAAGKAQL